MSDEHLAAKIDALLDELVESGAEVGLQVRQLITAIHVYRRLRGNQ